MKFLVSCLAVLICGVSAIPFDGPQCEAPNGGGLRPVIRELLTHIPKDKILEIYMEAVSEDAEVQAVMEYLSSDEFIKVVQAVQNAPEFDYLIKYSCDELYLDAHYYLAKLAEILGWPVKPKPPTEFMLMSADRRPGFRGMLLDILDLIPVEKLKAIIEEKLKTDEYVKKAFELLKSDKFKSIVGKVTSLEQYKHMVEELKKMGFDVEKIIKFLKDLFGW